MASTKQIVYERALAHLEAEHARLVREAGHTREAATHEDSRPENQYDTRGLELSYLAGAQASRLKELEDQIQIYRSLSLDCFDEDRPISVTALVKLEDDEGFAMYFLLPRGSGFKTTVDSTKITVISPASPVGQALLGKISGDEVKVRIAGKKRCFEVLSVA